LRRRMSQGTQNTAGAVFFGNHMAINMALGFLLYGAGGRTFGSSKPAVAALVVSLFPRFPLSPTDNRCHLQIFRHLHVLASESRCVEAEEVTSRVDVHLPMKLTPKSGNPANGESICLQTPCLAPPISTLEGLELGDDAHYPIRLDASGPEFSSLLQKGRIYVQKKARLQPLNGVQESPLRSAAVGGEVTLEVAAGGHGVSSPPSSSAEASEAAQAEVALQSLWQLVSAKTSVPLPAPLPVILWNLKIATQAASGSHTDGFSSSSGDGLSLGLPFTHAGDTADPPLSAAEAGAAPSLRFLQQVREKVDTLLTQQFAVHAGACHSHGDSAAGLLSPLDLQDKLATSTLSGKHNWVDIAERVQRRSPEAIQQLLQSGINPGC